MKYAADFRKIARETLYGKWKLAILVCFIALFLGATSAEGLSLELELEGNWAKAVVQFAGVTVGSFGGGRSSVIGSFLLDYEKTIAMISAVVSVFTLVFGCIVEVGYHRFHLNLLDRKEASLKDLFQYFYNWKTVFIANLLELIYVSIGLIFLIVPGIIMILNYRMVSYILAEYPEMTANEALRKSKEMMKGNRWRLFCLEFSFIGWEFLCAFTLGIGQLWLIPYKETAVAAFYRDISNTWDKSAEDISEDGHRQRGGICAVLIVFILLAVCAVLLKIKLWNQQESITHEDIMISNNEEIFSKEFWNNVTSIEYYEGSDIPYVVTDEAVLQEIGFLFSDLEYTETKPEMLEGGYFFDIYTENGEMCSIWVTDDIVDFHGIDYRVSTEMLGDRIRALIMENYGMSIHVEEYVTGDYRIRLRDLEVSTEAPLDLEIRFLTDKEENILQNSIDTEKEYDDLYVKLSDETDRTKAARVKLDEYELNFKFDIKTCEVFDVEKVTD